jgi:tRNA threonylcarbamoyladenosine modification (KEOPS) complex Cgi121 subunit
MIESLSNIDTKRMEVKEALPKTGITELFEQMTAINKTKGNVIQAFDCDSVINKTHLLGAYINAITAFGNHSNKAKSMSMEMLLFAAMTDQIGAAIKTVGAKENSKIIIFANNKKSFDGIKNRLTGIKDFRPTVQHIRKALRKFGMTTMKDADRLLLQKMATSRLKP